jgi:hypothetical protein
MKIQAAIAKPIILIVLPVTIITGDFFKMKLKGSGINY